MGTDSAKGVPVDHGVQGDLKEENRMGLGLAEQEELDQREEEVGIWRRQVKVRSRMAQSRQGATKKLHGTRTKTSCKGMQEECCRDGSGADLRGSG